MSTKQESPPGSSIFALLFGVGGKCHGFHENLIITIQFGHVSISCIANRKAYIICINVSQ